MVKDKTIEGHTMVVKEYKDVEEATNCQILFVSTSEKNEMAKVMTATKGLAILTVGETDGFIEHGGMINFVIEGTKVRFQINNEAATKAGLKISSKLMSLAVVRP